MKSGSATACCAGLKVFHTVQAPKNHKPVQMSSGSSIPGSTASTWAPNVCKVLAARATALATSGCTFWA